MNCTNCGASVADDAKFCPSCGQGIVSYPETPAGQYPPSYADPHQPAVAAMPGTENNKLYAIPLIFSFLGALLLIVDDFGGWYSSTYTGGGYLREWGWINIWTVAAVVIIPLVIALFYCTFISLQVVRSKFPPSLKHVRRGLFVAILVMVVVLVGGAAFIAATWDAAEQWLDLGFYGGFIGSLITAIFFGVEVRRLSPTSQPQPPIPAYIPTPPSTTEAYGQSEYQAPSHYEQPPQPQPAYAPPPQQPVYQQPPPQQAPVPPPQAPAQPYQCPNCTAPLQTGAKFCPSCGIRLS